MESAPPGGSSGSSGFSDHVIGLKVMRFTKPGLITAPISIGEEWEPIGRSLAMENNKDIRVSEDVPGLGISELLEMHQIPAGKENLIFLGETYRVFVSLGNEGEEPVTDVVLKVEMLSPSSRHLLHQSAPTSDMRSGERMDHVLSHDVKDMGEHTLVCTVSYSLSSGEEKLLRKLLHFSVAKPLEVRPDFQIVDDDILLTVQIQNVMHHPVNLDVVSFDPAAGFTSLDYNLTPDGESIFSDDDVFRPRTTRQYLYRVSPQINVHTTHGINASKTVSVGKMDIVWRSRFGERGRIQTGQLKASIPPPLELQAKLSESPGAVQLEKMFTVTLKLTNNSDRVMRLRCQMEKSPSSGVLWCNVITQVLDEIPPRESLEIKCTLLPILPGLQYIGPLTLTDVLGGGAGGGGKRYSFPKIGQVFVKNNSAPKELHPSQTQVLVNTTA